MCTQSVHGMRVSYQVDGHEKVNYFTISLRMCERFPDKCVPESLV